MYIVKLKLGNQEFQIHNEKTKLTSGSVKQGINSIDSFSFTILPNNVGFNNIRDFKTLISVYNEKRGIYEFQGRVLYSSNSMDNNGKISKSVVCESFLGYLQDSRQEYVVERNWTAAELLTQLLSVHNSQTEAEKHFKVGNVFTDENIYVGIQRESTWKMIDEKIIKKIGGEIQLRVENDGMYIDIVEKRGVTRATTIELSKNMLSITRESDPSSYITRLIPLGAKLKDENGNETEERVDITSVNSGKNYIDDETAIENFGLLIEYKYWDDVHEPNILRTKAIDFLTENNKVLQKFKISMLDLAILGIDIDYIDVCNYYPVKNKLLGIDETLRVIAKTIDVVNETSTNVEIGDNFKTLSDLQIENNKLLVDRVGTIEKNYVTNENVANIVDEKIASSSVIEQMPDQIMSKVEEEYVKTETFTEEIENIELKTLYTWIRYADDDKGTNISSDPTGKDYIGMAFNKETNTPTNNPSDYSWSKYTGPQGPKGDDGADGKDAAIQSATAPTDTSMLWYDTTTNTLKQYNGTEWIIVNDWSEDLNEINNNLSNDIKDVNNDLSNEIDNVNTNLQQIIQETRETMSTQLTQTAQDWTFNFNRIVEQITNIDGTVNSNYQEFVKYIQLKDGTITLGEVGNPLVLTLSNDRLSFKQNGIEVAYVSNNRLYIYDGEFLNSLKIGRWVFVPRSNGNLSFMYV